LVQKVPEQTKLVEDVEKIGVEGRIGGNREQACGNLISMRKKNHRYE
jgi:hypothetical protein